jgi:hypothetical protein
MGLNDLIGILTTRRHGNPPKIVVGSPICRDGDNRSLVWVRTSNGRTFLGEPRTVQLPLPLPDDVAGPYEPVKVR